MMVEWPFLAVPWGCLLFVIVVIAVHTHYFCEDGFIQVAVFPALISWRWIKPQTL